jgi:hypothetical protein
MFLPKIKCGSKWFRNFLKEFPFVRNYKYSTMSVHRAKKAKRWVLETQHNKFIAFLDNLEDTDALSKEQRTNLGDHMCAYDEMSVIPDGQALKRKLGRSGSGRQEKNESVRAITHTHAHTHIICVTDYTSDVPQLGVEHG